MKKVEQRATLRSLSLASVLSHSDNRRICGSLTLAQISPYSETSHIPGTLYEIPYAPTFILRGLFF